MNRHFLAPLRLRAAACAMNNNNKIDSINNNLPYPLGLPAKHLEKRIPATVTMNNVLMYYTLWNLFIMLVALVTRSPRIVLYSQASCLLVACIVAMAWLVLGWPFIRSFFESVLMTKTSWLIVLADAVLHFSPVLIMGMPARLALPVFMPLLTFWVWFMAMRSHLKSMYASRAAEVSSKEIDDVAIWGSLVWLLALAAVAYWRRS